MKVRLTRFFFLLFIVLVMTSCGNSSLTSTGSAKSTASEAMQKKFGDLSAMSKLSEMKAMLVKDSTLVHSRINGSNNEKPLHWAALSGNVKVVLLLIESGAEINVVDAQGMTPLHWAAWQGQLEVAKVLVSKGATINMINVSNHTPLDRAINDGKDTVSEYLKTVGGKQGKELK